MWDKLLIALGINFESPSLPVSSSASSTLLPKKSEAILVVLV